MDLQVGYETEVEIDVPKLPIKASTTIPPAFTRAWGQSSSFKEATSVFRSKHGMISIASGYCIQYHVSLNSFQLPLFTDPFKVALSDLYYATRQDEDRKKSVFKKFIKDFGTHFIRKADLGASFAQKSTYSRMVRNDFTFEQLQECSYKTGTEIFGKQVEEDTSKCTKSTMERLDSYDQSNYYSETITKGSRPTDIEEWVTQDFTPVPLRYSLSPIVNLFQEKYMGRIHTEHGQRIYPHLIREWLVPLYHNLCDTLNIDCNEPSGCGYDDKCPLDSECIKDPELDSHYCTEWSRWTCVTCGKGNRQVRERSECIGCRGIMREERDHACEVQPSCDKIGDCIILKGGWRKILTCPEGTVATGSCGSGRKYDCGRTQGYTNMLHCCKIRTPSKNTDCKTQTSSYGKRIECPPNYIANEYCGSGKGRECGGNANLLGCCDYQFENKNKAYYYPATSTCEWVYGTYGKSVYCKSGYVMRGSCGSGTGRECPSRSAHGAYCCELKEEFETAVDSCIMLQGGYGKTLSCPEDYVATGACGSGKHYNCGSLTANRLKCCKVTVETERVHCSTMPTKKWGKNQKCGSSSNGIGLVTQYCGSGKNRDCKGGNVNIIQCCEMTNLMTPVKDTDKYCEWIHGDYGEFIECKPGYAMAGACGSGQGRECDESSAHSIYCCKVE